MFTTAHEDTKILIDEQMENRRKTPEAAKFVFNINISMS